MTTINRRQFTGGAIAASAAVAVGAGVAGAASPAEAAAPKISGGLYSPNRSPLQPTAFLKLPASAVTPKGWLLVHLKKELAGLCGTFEQRSPYLVKSNSGWVDTGKAGNEEVPYWLRGYVSLAIVTRDATALDHSRQWFDAIFATRRSDGFFGPEQLRTSESGGPEYWPFLPLLQAMRTWYEYNGDSRVIPTLDGWFGWANARAQDSYVKGWVSTRWGDALDVAMWLYNQTGKSYLLDFVRKVHANENGWRNRGVEASYHNVNFAQGFREPAQFAQLSNDGNDTKATYDIWNTAVARWGQVPGGGLGGDEHFRTGLGDPRQGFETCGIVEAMASHQLLTRITGDAVWADRCEDLAFNSLPASLDPSGKSVHYITSPNSIDLDVVPKKDRQFDNDFNQQAFLPGVLPAPPSNNGNQYRCCPHNYGMGWPWFAEELWAATPDNGLAAIMYAPSSITAKVGASASTVTIEQTSPYPFDGAVRFTVSTSSPVAFPFSVRIPGWANGASVTVNGAAQSGVTVGDFFRMSRTWSNGDSVVLTLPQSVSVKTWGSQRNAVSVYRGPLAYSLKIEESFQRIGGSDQFPEYVVHRASDWNFSLVAGGALPVLTARSLGATADPFTLAENPYTLTAKARRLTDWTQDDENVVWPLQQSPARSSAAVQDVTLVPMGAARLRVSVFPTSTPDGTPWVGSRWYKLRNKHSGLYMAVRGASRDLSAQVTQFEFKDSGDHYWELVPNGDGGYRIRNANSGLVLAVHFMSLDNDTPIEQYSDDEAAKTVSQDHVWDLVADAGANMYRIKNRHTGKSIGVKGLSKDNDAPLVQYDDSSSYDHVWEFIPR